MKSKKILTIAAAVISLGACSTAASIAAADTVASEAVATATANETETTVATDTTTEETGVATDDSTTSDASTTTSAATVDTEAATSIDVGSSSSAGPTTDVSVESVNSVDELVALIQSAYGDASLGLHRGHHPVESTLVDVLGITHDEMHVRMETQGQNLAAVASDLGIDPETLIDALVDSWSPAIDNMLDEGTISQGEADAYLEALDEAFTYRVTWNGEDATPTFTGV